MRKAISLVEVLVAIILITVVIGTMLQMKSNNLFYLEKFKNTSLYNSYISLVINFDGKQEEETIYLDDIVDFDDDDIRKEFKEIKIKKIINDDEEIKLPANDYVKTAKVIETTFKIEDKSFKTFYKFELEY
jgi:hypothetical protein